KAVGLIGGPVARDRAAADGQSLHLGGGVDPAPVVGGGIAGDHRVGDAGVAAVQEQAAPRAVDRGVAGDRAALDCQGEAGGGRGNAVEVHGPDVREGPVAGNEALFDRQVAARDDRPHPLGPVVVDDIPDQRQVLLAEDGAAGAGGLAFAQLEVLDGDVEVGAAGPVADVEEAVVGVAVDGGQGGAGGGGGQAGAYGGLSGRQP